MADFEQYRDRRPNCPDPYQPTPKGCRHVAWGFSPRNEAPQPTQSPEGAQPARSDPLIAFAPSGLDDFWDHPYLGLKPQALCRRLFGADNGPFSPPLNKSPPSVSYTPNGGAPIAGKENGHGDALHHRAEFDRPQDRRSADRGERGRGPAGDPVPQDRDGPHLWQRAGHQPGSRRDAGPWH